MALFQKNPFDSGQHKALYSVGLSKTVLIVGLGNTGKEYDGTRHNVGFMCLDAFAAAHNLDDWVHKKDLKSLITSGTIGSTRVILCKPTTMMNLSGEAMQAVQQFYKITPNDTVIVHDELDVNFGQIRCRVGGGSAGNNGIKSVIQHGGAETGRVRIGIGPKTPEQMDSADFVLAKFSESEHGHLKDLTREVTALLTEYTASSELPHDTRSFLF